MSVVINGTGSISGLSNVGGVASAQSGSIIQTVTANLTSNTSFVTSASYADIGLSATITPQFSTSKILILIAVQGISTSLPTTIDTVSLILTDGSNNSLVSIGGPNIPGYNQAPYYAQPFTYVHSPATTSAFTYKVRGKSSAQTWQINNINISMPNPNSSITLMEIAQ